MGSEIIIGEEAREIFNSIKVEDIVTSGARATVVVRENDKFSCSAVYASHEASYRCESI